MFDAVHQRRRRSRGGAAHENRRAGHARSAVTAVPMRELARGLPRPGSARPDARPRFQVSKIGIDDAGERQRQPATLPHLDDVRAEERRSMTRKTAHRGGPAPPPPPAFARHHIEQQRGNDHACRRRPRRKRRRGYSTCGTRSPMDGTDHQHPVDAADVDLPEGFLRGVLDLDAGLKPSCTACIVNE